jgi:translocation and assembly module TamA
MMLIFGSGGGVARFGGSAYINRIGRRGADAARWVVIMAACNGAATAGCAHDDLGTGVAVHDLTLEGNKAFSDGDIQDKLATQKTGWWPFAKKKWFDQAAFDLDLKRITSFYADRGYFDARVVGHEIKKRADGSVDIVVTVQENSPAKIQDVRYQGFPPDEERQGRKLAGSWDVEAGKTFDYGDYATLKSKLADRQREDGYAYGKIDGQVSVDRDHHAAVIALTSQPGPKVRFGKTTVDGNGKIPAYALLNRVTWHEGDLFDPHDLATTQGRIYEFGVFSSVRLVLPDTPAEVADVRIEVKPGPLRELRVGGGVGAERQREEVRARFEYSIANFLGGLRKLRLRARPAYVVIPNVLNVQRSGFAAENDALLTQPDVFGSKVSIHALAGYDLGIAEGYQSYGPRGQLGLDRPFFRDRLLAGGSWNLQYLNFFNVDQDVFNDASNRFYGFKNPYRLAYLEAFAQLDLRNRPLDPTFGGYLALRAEEGDPSFGSDFHYVKLTPDLRLYAPLGRRVVVAVRGLVGWLRPYGGEESPITRRYALGGPASHRGFGFGRLAPQVADSRGRLIPVGGDGEVLMSGELRIQITKVGGNWLGVVPFVDAGDVTARFSGLDLGNLHLASGAALEYETPIGVVRAGLGVRLNRMGGTNPDPNDRIAFHITIGEAF